VLDLVGIVFSSVMMLFVIIRAVQLDRTRPWFETAAPDEPSAQEAAVKPVRGRKPRTTAQTGWVRSARPRGMRH
jgi:hypothetical protein